MLSSLAWTNHRELEAVEAVVAGAGVGPGAVAREFELAFAAYIGARHAISVAAGMAAFHLTFEAAGVRPDDEVLLSDYSFAAAAAATSRGARPVLVDVRSDAATLDVSQLRTLMTPRTRVIVAGHYGGALVDMDEILATAQRHDLVVVEDAVHALPASVDGRRAGTFGEFGVFAFGPDETMTTGEGGMITTDGDGNARLVRAARDLLDDDDPAAAGAIGVTYAMSDVNAALGLAQLRKLDRFHAIRSYYATVYRLGLDDLPELMLPRATEDGRHAWRLFMVELDLDRLTIDRNRFVGLLRDEDIGAGVPPRPLHLQSRYVGAFDPRNFPNALRLWSRAMSLPLYPRMTEGDVWRVISVIRRIVDRYRAFDAFRAHG